MNELKNDIVLKTFEEAATIVNEMCKIIDMYGFASIADLYHLVGVPYNYVDDDYGWTDIRDTEVIKVKEGYLLRLPRITPKSYETTTKSCTDKPFVKNDMVSHPSHYQSETGLEVIDVIEAFTFDLKGIEATDTGNIIKYICRWSKKNGLQDLEKAKWYLDHLINHVKKLEEENK